MHAVAQIYGTKKELTNLQLLLRLCYPHNTATHQSRAWGCML